MFSKRMTHQETLEAVLIHKGSKNINSPYHALIKAPARAPYYIPEDKHTYNTNNGARFTMHPVEFWALCILTPLAVGLGSIVMSIIFSRLRRWSAKSPFCAWVRNKQWKDGKWVEWKPMPDRENLCWLFFMFLPLGYILLLSAIMLLLFAVNFWAYLWAIGLLNGIAFVWLMFRELSGLYEMLADFAVTRDDI